VKAMMNSVSSPGEVLDMVLRACLRLRYRSQYSQLFCRPALDIIAEAPDFRAAPARFVIPWYHLAVPTASPRGFCTSTVFAQFECDTIIDRVIAGMERETQRKRTAWLTRVHCGHLWAKLLALFDLSAPVA
jgi:hypothetical protein